MIIHFNYNIIYHYKKHGEEPILIINYEIDKRYQVALSPEAPP